MAWLSLVIVALLFYTPIIGLGQTLIPRDWIITVPLPIGEMALTIPYTGGVRLLFVSLVVWAALWGVAMVLERMWVASERTQRPQWLTSLGLRDDLVYAVRPYLGLQIATWLAQIAVALMVVLAALSVLIPILLVVVMPWLEAQLVAWLAPWLGAEIAATIGPLLARGLQGLLGGVRQVDYPGLTGILGVLVLSAERVQRWEKRYRLNLDLRRHRSERRARTGPAPIHWPAKPG